MESILTSRLSLMAYLGSVHTYPDIFKNTSLYPCKKYPRLHEGRVQNHSRPLVIRLCDIRNPKKDKQNALAWSPKIRAHDLMGNRSTL